MKKILIIQSYKDLKNEEGERQDYLRTLDGRADLEFISSLDISLPWTEPSKILERYDGVVFGGSSDFDFDGGRESSDPVLSESKEILERMRPLIEYILNVQFPCMGICYGHQIIGLIQGAEVKNDKSQNKLGTFFVSLTEEGKSDALFGNLPAKFYAQYDHKDSLVKLPNGATLLGFGDRCRFSALRYGSNCYTIQFHVEFTEREMHAEYRESSERFPTDIPLSELLKPSLEASTLLPVFVDKICLK